MSAVSAVLAASAVWGAVSFDAVCCRSAFFTRVVLVAVSGTSRLGVPLPRTVSVLSPWRTPSYVVVPGGTATTRAVTAARAPAAAAVLWIWLYT